MDIRTARGRLFVLLLLLLAVPMLAGRFHFIKEWELKGDVRNEPRPAFSWKGWWDGAWQEKMNNHLNDSVGGRTWLVRINNQLDYSLFGKLHANSVVMGKNHCLYEKGYIDAYCGRGFQGKDFVRDQVSKLKFIQDTLDKTGTRLVVVYAPSKVRFYPGFLPDSLSCVEPADNYYHEFLRIGDSLHLRQLNFNGWFAGMKNKYAGKQLLMSRQGIHWTVFGAMLATDSLLRFMEKQMNANLPDISWKIDDNSYTTDARNADADLARGLNTLLPVTTERFCYPEITVDADSTKYKKPKAIYIADSFFWVVMYTQIIQRTHQQWQFWYYFHEIWGSDIADGSSISQRDWMKDLPGKDFVVLLYTEQNLGWLGSGFIDEAYRHFTAGRQ